MILPRTTKAERVVLASLLMTATATLAAAGSSVTAIDVRDQWRYLVAAGPGPSAWSRPGFDHSGWRVGRAGFGFSDPNAATELPAIAAGGTRLLLRREFVVHHPDRVTGMFLTLASDGAFTAFLNGIEILSSPAPLPHRDTPAGSQPIGRRLDLSGIAHELVEGSNLMALEVRAAEPGRPGFVVLASLELVLADPEPLASARSARAGPMRRLPHRGSGTARHLIVMICDGWGPNQVEATNRFFGFTPPYQSDTAWVHLWMSTNPDGGAYDPDLAWSDLTHLLASPTDSAAAATAMVTGTKTRNQRISVDPEGTTRLASIGERARQHRMAVGVITTVPVSHATPGAFTSHNSSRTNTFAIADEAFFGHPDTTGTAVDDPKYDGGFGPTLPPPRFILGDRSPAYVNPQVRDRLFYSSGLPGEFLLVEGAAGEDGGAALLAAAGDPSCTRLAGLFDRVQLRATTPGLGYQLETPSLAQSTSAALSVLGRDGNGFVLLVEGGAVDWAGHANDMDWMVGELSDFNDAVGQVVDWVDDPGNGSSWDNTLVVVTGDHETGLLTSAPGTFPDQPLGDVTTTTLGLEKIDLVSGRRASWLDDSPPNDAIDPGETVYWSWTTGSHSTILIPLHARGPGASSLAALAVSSDPVRGPYIDNTDVFVLLSSAMPEPSVFADGFESGDTTKWSSSSPK